MPLLSLWLLSACAPADDAPGVEADAPLDTGPPSWESGEAPPEAALSAEEVVAEIETLLADGMPDPAVGRDIYLDLMGRGDAECPGDDEQLDPVVVPMDGCTSSTGLWYAGASLYEVQGDGWVLSTDLEIVDEDGGVFLSGGFAYAFSYGNEDYGGESRGLSGVWSYPPSEAAWMSEGISAMFNLNVERTPGQEVIWLDGGLTRGERTVSFIDLRIGECDGPSGAIMLYQRGDGWYTVSLACASCGPLDFEGAPMGEVCLDLGGLR